MEIVGVKEAAKSALNFYRDIYPEIQGELIEEVEYEPEQQVWLITLSFPVENDSQTVAFLQPKMKRRFKVFRINSTTGEVESMKIREFSNESTPV
ncbi:hypothetical protein [Spirosoma montaniterrae]|uniref:PepSY domain-containing protein n=1 Tax=Spirosoma montaniterrae TaxID=1178516 RepID=A0A1P9WS18_9BACT|nr:hypothetical protein [Spirosoma montaniterrae]AQG78175.1 hypothetical protein AWR27_01715 [Spirosoma montaniterrae]